MHSDYVFSVIKHSRISLFYNKTGGVKEGNNYLFDVTKGSYDVAKICKLVRLYLFIQSLIELSMILLHNLKKKDFQSPLKQILLKQIFSMLPSTLQQRKNTFLFEWLIIHHSTTTLFLTTHLQSSNSCLMVSKRISD